VNEQGQTDKRAQALATLLDDPSPVVRKALLDEFSRQGEAGVAFLKRLAEEGNRLRGWHARWYLAELRNSDPIAEFRSFIRSQNYELETGSLLLCRIAYPDLDVGAFCHQLDAIAARCRELIAEPASAKDRCLAVNRVLFHEMGFRGNADDDADPANAFVTCVIDSRKGLPIALSILYLLVGQRIGLELEPVSLPDHFVVASFDKSRPFYIDPFERGKIWSVEQLLSSLEEANAQPKLHHLAPAPVREVLCRCCRSLARRFTQSGELHMGKLFRSFVDEFEAAHQRRAQP